MDVRIEPSWKKILAEEWEKPYFHSLANYIRERYSTQQVYPPGSKIFSAFDQVAFDDVKVVIVGQDPYHGPGQANGLCFAVNEDIACPPSLRNIFKEIQNDIGVIPFPNGDLSRWARQGVLLLNSTLTVEEGKPGSHQGKGWEIFTDSVINNLNNLREHLVFLLWGSYAIQKGASIDKTRHLILTSAHPSPLSAHRGFLGNRHFSQTNNYLAMHGKKIIDWR